MGIVLVATILSLLGPVDGSMIFADGFESGDTSMWSLTVSGGDGCDSDPYEPNDAILEAANLGTISSDQVWPQGSFRVDIDPEDDKDWFSYDIVDTPGWEVRPRLGLTSIPSEADLDLCAYYLCDSVGIGHGVTCMSGVESQHENLDGCCSTNTGSTPEYVVLAPDCGAGSASAAGTVYFYIYPSALVATCQEAEVSWGDD